MPKQPNPNKPTELDPIPIVLPPFSVSEDQDFALEIVVTGKSKTIVHPDNFFLFLSPGQKATLTNLDDPSKTVTFGITGSFHRTTLDDGTVVTKSHGRSLLFDPLIDDGKMAGPPQQRPRQLWGRRWPVTGTAAPLLRGKPTPLSRGSAARSLGAGSSASRARSPLLCCWA